MNTEEIIYLDNAATTYPKPETVYTEMDRVNRSLAFNAGRGSYALAKEADEIIAETREALLDLVHAKRKQRWFYPPLLLLLSIRSLAEWTGRNRMWFMSALMSIMQWFARWIYGKSGLDLP